MAIYPYRIVYAGLIEIFMAADLTEVRPWISGP